MSLKCNLERSSSLNHFSFNLHGTPGLNVFHQVLSELVRLQISEKCDWWPWSVHRARPIIKLSYQVIKVAAQLQHKGHRESSWWKWNGIAPMWLQRFLTSRLSLSDSSYLCCRQSSMWKPQVRNHCQCYWQVHQTPRPFQTGVDWIMRRATRGLPWDHSNSLSNRLNELWKQTEKDLGVSLREWLKDTEHSQNSLAGGSWEWKLQ